MHGRESDILLAEVAQRVVDTLPFGLLDDVDSAGHGVPADNPDAFEVAVRNFLSSSLEINKGNESQAV